MRTARFEINIQGGKHMDKKLSEFKAGDEGDVKSVAGEGRIRRRLFDMGREN